MKPALRLQLDRYVRRLAELDSLLADPAVMRDAGGFRALSREHVEVSGIVERQRRHAQRERDLAAAAEMASDPELAAMAAEEAASAQAELDRLATELQRLLLPRDPDDARSVFLEIRAGTGGDESALFAGDLLRMYTRYAERKAGASSCCRRATASWAATRRSWRASRATRCSVT
ncbi:Peptide chain release factor 1 [Methylibium sp. T29]|nr:Peptide chain release factor 1 [Methylibium sp. T29]